VLNTKLKKRLLNFLVPGTKYTFTPMAHIRFLCRLGTDFSDKVWMSSDICGLICALLCWLLHIFSFSVVSDILSPELWDTSPTLRLVLLFAYTIFFVLSLTSHFMAMFTDPGAVPKSARPISNYFETMILPGSQVAIEGAALQEKEDRIKKRSCPRCGDIFKPPRAHHGELFKRASLVTEECEAN